MKILALIALTIFSLPAKADWGQEHLPQLFKANMGLFKGHTESGACTVLIRDFEYGSDTGKYVITTMMGDLDKREMLDLTGVMSWNLRSNWLSGEDNQKWIRYQGHVMNYIHSTWVYSNLYSLKFDRSTHKLNSVIITSPAQPNVNMVCILNHI